MRTNEITIEDIRNMDEETREMIDIARKLSDKQLDLLLEILDLTTDRPDRWQYVMEYIEKKQGKMADLPAALAQI